MEDNRIRLGIVGLGYISRYFIAAIKKSLRCYLVAVCDLNEKFIEPYGKEGIATYTDYHQLVLDENVDAIIVLLPNNLHYQVSRDALLANKHVCCEKPLTITLVDAQDLSKLSLEKKVVLFGAFHRSYNKNLIKVIDKIKSNPIVYVEASYLEKIEKQSNDTEDSWYFKKDIVGGGCIMDNGPNVYDVLVRFMGHLEVTRADIAWKPDNFLETAATVTLVSDQGVTAVVHLDWGYEGEIKTVIVTFQDGTKCMIDMLADVEGFRSSLWHEYEAIIDDFCSRIELCRVYYNEKPCPGHTLRSNAMNIDLHGEEAVDIVRLVCNTYVKGNEQCTEHKATA